MGAPSAPHQPIIENYGGLGYGGLGMTWIAACWCGTFRGTYRSEGSARAAHAEHVAGASHHG